MAYLVTGAAGFIGMSTARVLLARGEQVIGIDNLNDYYEVALKRERLNELTSFGSAFTFVEGDLADIAQTKALFDSHRLRRVIHLAAQPGVRYSLENPHAYIQSNIVGHLNIIEGVRHSDTVEHLAYASSSSVYGANEDQPFSESDRVDMPVSLYAATKRSDELMSRTYSHLYGISQVGLRFFTVYGPWGRPDMAPWLFTDAIFKGNPIKVFNNGEMKRDFTFIDDIVSGVIASADMKPLDGEGAERHRVYNIGNNRSERLMDFIGAIEAATGREAEKIMMPMQPGDVYETYANIDKIQGDLGFAPTTSLSEGIPKFVDWFKRRHGIA
jgi:UDP-glucuronate 4-epimerase